MRDLNSAPRTLALAERLNDAGLTGAGKYAAMRQLAMQLEWELIAATQLIGSQESAESLRRWLAEGHRD